MKKDQPQKLVKSAIRTMQLFAVFAEARRPLSLGELAEAMSAPKSSCHELIHTLVHLGYVLAINGGRSYYPSRRLVQIAEQLNQFNPIKEKIQNELRRLRDDTGETVMIGRLQGAQVVFSEVFDGTHAIRFTATAGDLKDLHVSSLGKALLSGLETQERQRLLAQLKLRRVSEQTLTRRQQLEDNLQQGAQQGFFTAEGEDLADVMGIAVPVEVQGYLLAIGMAGPMPRMQQNRARYGRALQAVAAEISR